MAPRFFVGLFSRGRELGFDWYSRRPIELVVSVNFDLPTLVVINPAIVTFGDTTGAADFDALAVFGESYGPGSEPAFGPMGFGRPCSLKGGQAVRISPRTIEIVIRDQVRR